MQCNALVGRFQDKKSVNWNIWYQFANWSPVAAGNCWLCFHYAVEFCFDTERSGQPGRDKDAARDCLYSCPHPARRPSLCVLVCPWPYQTNCLFIWWTRDLGRPAVQQPSVCLSLTTLQWSPLLPGTWQGPAVSQGEDGFALYKYIIVLVWQG